jgi:hypothetical protein
MDAPENDRECVDGIQYKPDEDYSESPGPVAYRCGDGVEAVRQTDRFRIRACHHGLRAESRFALLAASGRFPDIANSSHIRAFVNQCDKLGSVFFINVKG